MKTLLALSTLLFSATLFANPLVGTWTSVCHYDGAMKNYTLNSVNFSKIIDGKGVIAFKDTYFGDKECKDAVDTRSYGAKYSIGSEEWGVYPLDIFYGDGTLFTIARPKNMDDKKEAYVVFGMQTESKNGNSKENRFDVLDQNHKYYFTKR